MSSKIDNDGYRTARIIPGWLVLKYKFNSEYMRDWLELTFNAEASSDTGKNYTNYFCLRLFNLFQAKLYTKRFVKPLTIDYVSKCGEYKYPLSFDKQYGFRLTGGNSLNVYYGTVHRDDMYRGYAPNRRKSWDLGYGEMRMVKYSLLDSAQRIKHTYENKNGLKMSEYYDPSRQVAKQLREKLVFEVTDNYDGTLIKGSILVKRSEYVRGTGMWKWLAWFTKRKIYTNLDLDFEKEVGVGKGEWKGGLTGLSIPILPDQSVMQALQTWTNLESEKPNRGSRHRIDITAIQLIDGHCH